MSVTPSKSLEIGKEYIEPNEQENTQKIIDMIRKHLSRNYPAGKTLRQFHAKMHGCVKAIFRVLPDIPLNYHHGFLIPGKSYDAWIRFSNGSPTVVKDSKADLRGMAIKLLNVDGEMLVQDHQLPQSQDFLLVSYPTLMSPKVSSFVANVKAVCNGTLGLVLFALNPLHWMAIYRTLQSQKKTNNLFSLVYYSVSPFRLGTSDQAIKYAAFPVSNTEGEAPDKNDDHFLRKKMLKDLSSNSIFYDFKIQFQEDASSMPIEDVCVEWKSEWHTVARIEIVSQNFDTPTQNTFGENLTYSPWHSHSENRPLGGINRARKTTYEAIGKFRVDRNRK